MQYKWLIIVIRWIMYKRYKGYRNYCKENPYTLNHNNNTKQTHTICLTITVKYVITLPNLQVDIHNLT